MVNLILGLCIMPMLPARTKVDWRRLVYNNQACPSSVFILWLAILGRLATKDRICRWNATVDLKCVLCHQENESIEHLLFKCSYSQQIWQPILEKLQFQRFPMGFQAELQIMKKVGRRRTACCKLLSMAFAEGISAIWNARNKCVFDNVIKPCNTVIREIIFRVACRSKEDFRRLLVD